MLRSAVSRRRTVALAVSRRAFAIAPAPDQLDGLSDAAGPIRARSSGSRWQAEWRRKLKFNSPALNQALTELAAVRCSCRRNASSVPAPADYLRSPASDASRASLLSRGGRTLAR